MSNKVYQYNLSGAFIAEHESVSSAARAIGTSRQGVSNCVQGHTMTCRGYRWSFEKMDKLKGSVTISKRMITNERISKSLRRDLPFHDMGVITDRNHRDFGRRKITLGSMEIYCNPSKPVEEIVEKYSQVNLDF